jgi:hypothetical protein
MLSLLSFTRINFYYIRIEILFSLSLWFFVLLNYYPIKIEILNDLVSCLWVSNYFLSMFDFILKYLYVLHKSALNDILDNHLSFDLCLTLLQPRIHDN